jgi:hypothetical protein
MEKSSLKIKTGEVTLNIAAPIPTAGFSRDNKDDLIDSVRTVICEGFEKS